jgi:hypothetical protein
MQYEASYIPRQQEQIAAVRAAIGHHFLAIKRFNFWSNFVIYCVLMAGLTIFAPRLFARLQPELGSARSVWVIVAFTVAVILLAALTSQRLCRAWLVRTLDRQTAEPVTVHMTEKGISWTGAHHGSWLDWSAVDRAMLLPPFLLLISGDRFYVLPRRAFKSDDEMSTFVKAAWARLTEEARRLSHIHPSLQARLNLD